MPLKASPQFHVCNMEVVSLLFSRKSWRVFTEPNSPSHSQNKHLNLHVNTIFVSRFKICLIFKHQTWVEKKRHKMWTSVTWGSFTMADDFCSSLVASIKELLENKSNIFFSCCIIKACWFPSWHFPWTYVSKPFFFHDLHVMFFPNLGLLLDFA